MLEHSTETIAAIATPAGVGGLSVIRASGTDAIALADKVFRGKKSLASASTHTAHFGQLYSPDGARLDEVVATVFRSPNSYTGEDVVEISCHGGSLVTRKILESIIAAGARHAQPGEFTKRAFLNNKMDLSQAEAVADLIHARSEKAREISLQQLRGSLSEQINHLRDNLVKITGMLELELDFAEDGYEFADRKKLETEITGTLGQLDKLLDSYGTGKLYRDGVRIVLAGMPNVGKSSLLNALLRENRAIVTDIPGTTRDTIEESLSIDGILFTVVDTAGLRETVDRVELEGVRRSHDQVKSGDLLLLVMDESRKPTEEELALAKRLLKETKREATPVLLVLNKIDIKEENGKGKKNHAGSLPADRVVEVSALTGEGLDDLRTAVSHIVQGGEGINAPADGVVITNERHFEAIQRTRESLQLGLQSLGKGESPEFIAVDLRAALDRLGEITGTVTTDDILNEVFSKFCIGK